MPHHIKDDILLKASQVMHELLHPCHLAEVATIFNKLTIFCEILNLFLQGVRAEEGQSWNCDMEAHRPDNSLMMKLNSYVIF